VLLPYFDECSANLGDAATLFDDVVALCQAAEAQELSRCRCTDQSAPCWPSATVWNQLNVSVGGRLLVPDWAGFQHCFGAPSGLPECVSAVGKSRSNNFMNQLHAGLTESTGWFNGWDATPSTFAVEATTAADIQAAVRFAAAHNLRVVIKGTGHDYKGRSTAPNSLLIWTHLMRDIKWSGDDITVGAGVTWDEVRSDLQPRTCTHLRRLVCLTLNLTCPLHTRAGLPVRTGEGPHGGGWRLHQRRCSGRLRVWWRYGYRLDAEVRYSFREYRVCHARDG